MTELLKVVDISPDTLMVSLVIAAVGWLLKNGLVLLKEAVGSLIKTLIETMAEVSSFRNDLKDIKEIMGQVPKLQADMNEYYRRLKAFEEQLKPKN